MTKVIPHAFPRLCALSLSAGLLLCPDSGAASETSAPQPLEEGAPPPPPPGPSAKRPSTNDSRRIGLVAYKAKDFDQAVSSFEEAFQLMPGAWTALWSARSLEKVGRLAEASERYEAALSLPDSEKSSARQERAAREIAQSELDELLPRVPTVSVRVAGIAPERVLLSLSGRIIPASSEYSSYRTDPGNGSLSASFAGALKSRAFTLAEGESTVVVFDFEDSWIIDDEVAPSSAPETPLDPEKQARSQRIRNVGITSLVLGSAGITFGALAGIVMISDRNSLSCEDGLCNDPSETEAIDRYNGLRTASTVSLIAGGLLVGAGVTLLLTHPKEQEGPELRARLAPNGALLEGSF